MFRGIYTIIWTENSSTTWFSGCRRWIVDREVLSSIPMRCRIAGTGHPCEASTEQACPDSGLITHWNPEHEPECEAQPVTPDMKMMSQQRKKKFGIPHVPAC